MIVRRLGPDDAALYRRIRREALVNDPDRFVMTIAELESTEDAALAVRLRSIATFAAIDGDVPVALMAYRREAGPVLGHRASLINVYVSPAARGGGLARDLLDRVLAEAMAEGVMQMELVVTVENAAAIAFYRRADFRIVGTLPNAFRHGSRLIDEHIMVRPLCA